MKTYRVKSARVYAERWQPAETPPPVGEPDAQGVIWEYGPAGAFERGRLCDSKCIIYPGDWIVLNIDPSALDLQERRPCSPEVFAETYECETNQDAPADSPSRPGAGRT